MLMGCSSGALREGGGRGGSLGGGGGRVGTSSSSSSAAPAPLDGGTLRWLASGCPSAIANLWDVTDRDIDRFAAALLGEWLLLDEEEGGGGSGGGEDEKEKSGDERSGGGATTTSDNNKDDGDPHTKLTRCVAASVARARRACRLPSLIGAAPVVYGVPTAVKVARGGRSGGKGQGGTGGKEEESGFSAAAKREEGAEENFDLSGRGKMIAKGASSSSSSSATPRRPGPPRARASANGRTAAA